MKNIHSLIFLTFFVTISYAQDFPIVTLDSLKAYEIPQSYANRQGIPYKATNNTPYIFRTPEVYFINSASYNLMKNTFREMKRKDSIYNEINKNYTATLERNERLERQLKSNFVKSDSLDQVIYQKTQATLIHTQKALDYTINSLEKATNSLEIVEKTTKRQRAKSTFEKILFAIGGVGIGVLVGVSL